MKLLLIRQNYPPERGAVRYMRDLATSLAGKGNQVTVITGLPNYPLGKPYEGYGRFRPDIRTEEKGVRVIRVPLIMASNRQPMLRILSFFSFFISGLIAGLSIRKLDAIVSSVPPVTVSVLGLILSKLKGVPLVMMIHDYEPLRSLELRGMPDSRLSRLMIDFFTAVYRQADRIVVTMETEQEEMVKRGVPAGQIEILTHGIDLNRFSQLSQNRDLFRIPVSDKRFCLLYMGTIGVAHDMETTLRCFAHPLNRDFPLDIIIIGDGECAAQCRQTVTQFQLNNVAFFPPIDLETVPGVLVQADILLCSQKPDLFAVGAKFYEYLAAGKPILANCTGVLARKLKEIGNGWIFAANNPEELNQALNNILESSENVFRRMGKRGKEYARTHYDAEIRHSRWANLLKELV